jgi:hypothetical protein
MKAARRIRNNLGIDWEEGIEFMFDLKIKKD